jgi:hypothetical protein
VEGARQLYARYPSKAAAAALPTPHYISAFLALVVGLRAVQYLRLPVADVGAILFAHARSVIEPREGASLTQALQLARDSVRVGMAGAAEPAGVPGVCGGLGC